MRPTAIWRVALTFAIGALVVFFWLEHLGLALDKKYSIDEFQYAHGAWLTAQGEVIYRDFFEHHFPLVHQLMSLVFLVAGDQDPSHLIYLRLAMLPFLTLTLAAAWGVNAAAAGRFSAVTMLLVLMVPSFSMMATEVRPDPLAFSLFLAALAVLYWRRLDGRWRGFASGFLFVAALWGTLKVAYYGLVFPAALVADLAAARSGRKSYFLGHPGAFLAGGAAAGLPIALYLTWTSSWGAWFEWCIRWSFVHQLHYPGFLWTRNFMQLLAQSFWLFPLAVVGLVVTLRGRPAANSPDWLLLGCAATTLASFAWQSAAYLYSLIPFTVVLCVFAGRGLVASMRFFRGLAPPVGVFAGVLLALVFVVELQRSRTAIGRLAAATNDAQHALLARVQALTRPDEPVLNIAGGQIARPSVHFFYFFEAVIRQLKHDVFAYELPQSLVERGCVAYMPSERFGRLPEPLRRFLLENFQPYDRELWFWGRRYPVPAGGLTAEFMAVRGGRYFVWPLAAPQAGEVVVGGRILTAPVVELAAGSHPVSYRGEASEIFVIWLPADAQPFAPRPEVKAGLSAAAP